MSHSDSTGNPLTAQLRDIVAPELFAQLADTGTLSPEQIAAECTRLRGDLAAIATYIPSTIVRAQLAQPSVGQISGAYWNGSVLFADLSGFTALSGTLSALGKQGAEEISSIINSLFGALLEEIHRYQGGLLKFGGDALTAFFDEALLGAEHAALACRAALAMQQRMEAFAALVTRTGTFQLRLRIGVHSGQVFAAQVGDSEHIELVVTGRNINRVALAQEIAEPGEVVVSSATLRLLPEHSSAERQSGFSLLSALPYAALPPATTRWGRALGRGDMDELLRLARQIAALRPYLPRGLPRRFLTTDQATETGEFRPVTVLFANFFPFSTALDILGEDSATAAQMLNAYYRRAQEVIHRYGGIINKVDMYTYGDKLMALFGAPVAHEDDPVRAARAALELRSVLEQTNAEVRELLKPWSYLIAIDEQFFKQRIGINTGVVFAGQVGSARRHEYTVMGQAVNLSARLMSAAEQSAIVLSPTAQRAAERHIALQPLDPVKLKGITDPVPIAAALYPFEVAKGPRRGSRAPDLVGRAGEQAQILDVARGALGGSGRVIALVGDAGTGKSRLIEYTLQQMVRLSGRREVAPFFPYSAECQSYDQNTPYAVIRELLRQFFHLGLSDEAHEDAQQVAQMVADLAPALARFTPLLSDILGLPFEDTPLTAALSPEQRHDRGQELVEELLLAESRRQPLLLIVDDLHWGDASSLDLLARLARAATRGTLLLLLGYRLDPPIAEPWRDLEHCARLEISELTQADSAALVHAVLKGTPPPELATLIEKAQGNPFFIEEVVRSLIESGILDERDGAWQLTRALDEAAVPDSIEGVITARLDRLEERNREILQVASVIGRRFPHPVLSGVVPGQDLADRLHWLIEGDLLAADELEREIAYLFKHALTRDVAYESILYARRRELHRRVAQQIEQRPERIEEQLALLARHYLLAEDWTPAFDYHLRAGEQAQSRYANREAIVLYERALQIARFRFASAAESTQKLSQLNEQLGVVRLLIGEYDTALTHYQQALELLRQAPDYAQAALVRQHYYIARVYEKRAEFETAFEWIERALRLAGNIPSRELVRCLLLGAGLHMRQGRNSQALEWGERALQLAETLGSLSDRAEAFMQLGSAYSNQGDNTRAFELASRSLGLYEQANDLARLADAQNNVAIMCQMLGRLGEARMHFEAGAAIKETIGDVYGQGMIACNLGELFRIQDRLDDAIAQYRAGLAIYERIGSLYMSGVLQMNLGAAYLLKGELETAEGYLRRSTELFEQAGAEDFLPELDRYLAELHLRRGNLSEARLACEMSLSNAARLEARAEEGATRRTLAQILIQDGDPGSAWQELGHSLAILRDAANPQEIARTLIAQAALAPALGRRDAGQTALGEALPIVREIGLQRDIDEAHAIAAQHHYILPH